MKKLLVVYNVCGLSGAEHVVWYIDQLRALISQQGIDHAQFKFAVSGCMIRDATKRQMEEYFGNIVSFNWVEENVPVSVTFNDTIDKCVQHWGPFTGYLYVDSGCSLWDPTLRLDALARFYEVFMSGPYAVCAAVTSNDMGGEWWGWHLEPGKDLLFGPGKACNMHFQIFSEDWRQQYRRILPDIFASHTMESVFAGMAAAIHRRFILTQAINVLHAHSLDGASIGSRQADPDRIPCSDTFESGGLLFKTKKTMDQRYREGHELGFGWEECKPYWPHDPAKFDQERFAVSPLLKDFYRDEVFLKKEEFDYSQLRAMFHPAKG